MPSVKWPKSNIDFYKKGIDPNNLVSLYNDDTLENLFYAYGNNFFETADLTNLYVCQEGLRIKDIAKLDSWFYPVIYMYRQSLELLLKACLFQNITQEMDRIDALGVIRHDLKTAFDEVLIRKGLSTADNENAQWLDSYLSNIKSIDNSSDMFRYPFGNDGHTLFQSKSSIDLVALHYNMKRAFEIINVIFERGTMTEISFEKQYSPELFIQGKDYYTQSVVGYKFRSDSFLLTCSSYSEVGAYLRKQITSHGQTKFFIPMCYMYRNAIELGLKRIIVEDCSFGREESYKILRKKKHSIVGLWNKIPQDIKQYISDAGGQEALQSVNGNIQYFHNLDAKSDMFRYPCNTKLEIYFTDETILDVENVAGCFEELYTVLDFLDTVVNERG